MARGSIAFLCSQRDMDNIKMSGPLKMADVFSCDFPPVRGELPFFRLGDEPGEVLRYWVPVVTGSAGEDRAIGGYYAAQMVEYLRDNNHQIGVETVLADVIGSMVFDGSQDNVNKGFIECLAAVISEG